MSTQVSVHGVTSIRARSFRTSGAPLTLELESYRGVFDYAPRSEVTLFTDDQILTDMLIDAINGAVAARKAQIAALAESEAA